MTTRFRLLLCSKLGCHLMSKPTMRLTLWKWTVESHESTREEEVVTRVVMMVEHGSDHVGQASVVVVLRAIFVISAVHVTL